jgi:hypothetical protein
MQARCPPLSTDRQAGRQSGAGTCLNDGCVERDVATDCVYEHESCHHRQAARLCQPRAPGIDADDLVNAIRPSMTLVMCELGEVFDDWELALWFARAATAVWAMSRIGRYIAAGC